MTATADHDREPLPLQQIGWAITGAVFVFGAWGYVTAADVFEATNWRDFLKSSGAGYLLMVALGGIMQWVGATGARSIRRSKSFELEMSRRLSIGLVVAGGSFTAYTVHNAFEQTGMLDGKVAVAALAWLVSIAIAFCELSLWWIDESHRSEAKARRDAETAAEITRRNAPPPTPTLFDIADIDEAGLSDEAIAAGISAAASIKKRLENERANRAKRTATSNGLRSTP